MAYFPVIDFNMRQTSEFFQGFAYAPRETGVCSIDGAPVWAESELVDWQVMVIMPQGVPGGVILVSEIGRDFVADFRMTSDAIVKHLDVTTFLAFLRVAKR